MRTSRTSLALAAAAALWGCGGSGNSLSGSIASTFDLGFTGVQFEQVASSYVLAYTSGAQTTLKLVYTPPAGTYPPIGTPIALDFSASSQDSVSRQTDDDVDFPQAQSGTLTLQTDLSRVAVGATVTGSFGVVFTSGQTVDGDFAAPFSIVQNN